MYGKNKESISNSPNPLKYLSGAVQKERKTLSDKTAEVPKTGTPPVHSLVIKLITITI